MGILFIIICILIVVILYLVMKNKTDKASEQFSSASSYNSEKEKNVEYDYAKKDTKTIFIDGQKIILDVSMIPKRIDIDKNFLPYLVNRQYGYGKRFNAFVLDEDNFFHKGNCTLVKGKKKHLLHRYFAIKKYSPCPICNPNTTIDEWYISFLKNNFIENSQSAEEMQKLYATGIQEGRLKQLITIEK